MAKQWDYNIADCRNKLNPSDAVFLSRSEASSVPLNNEKEVRIGWAFSTNKNFANFEHFLQDYTWPTNKKKQRWVDGPAIDSIDLPGKWRQAFTTRVERKDERGNDEFLIVITLRRGWAEAADWSEARVRRAHVALSNTEDSSQLYGSDDATLALDVEFPNFSPFHAVAAGGSLPAARSTFAVNGNAVTGTFHKQMVDLEEQEDGSHTLIARYSKPQYTLTGHQAWLLSDQSLVKLCWGVPKDLAQTIITSFQAKGYSVDPSFSKDQELVNLRVTIPSFIAQILTDSIATNTCDRFWYSSLYSGIEDSTLYTIPDSPTSGVQYDRDIRFDNKGSYDIIVRKGVRQHRAYNWRTAAVSTLETESLHEQMGVTTQDVVDISAPPRGSIYRQDVSITPDCSKDYVTRRNQGIYAATDLLNARETALEAEIALIFENMEGQPDLLGSATQGFVYATESTINRFGYYDGKKRAVRGKQVTSEQASNRSALSTVTDTSYNNSPDAIAARARTAGQRSSARSTLNEFGYYNGRESLEEALVVSADSTTANRATSTTSSIGYRNNPDVIAARAVSAGTIAEATSSINEFGYYDGREDVSEAILVSALDIATGASTLETETTDLYENNPTPLDVETATAGVIASSASTINSFGYYDGNRRFQYAQYGRTGISQTASGAMSETHADRFVNSDVPAEAPDADAGTLFNAASTINRFGYYDGTYAYEQAILVSAPDISTGATPLETETTDLLVNSPTPAEAPAAVAGIIASAASTINRFGYYDGNNRFQYAQYDNTGLRKESASPISETHTDRFLNSAANPTTPAAAAGVIFEATSSLNRYGYYDGLYGVNVAIYGNTGIQQTESNARSDTHTNRFVNSETPAVAPDAPAGTRFSAVSTINRFGYFDGVYSYEQASPKVDDFRFVSAQTGLSTGYDTIYSESPNPTEAPDDSVGVTHSAQNTLTRFGYYDGRIRENRSIPNVRVAETLNSALFDRTASIYRNKVGEIGVPASVQGVIYAANSTLQDDKTYNGAVRTILSVEKEVYIPWSTNGDDAAMYVFRNRRSLPTDLLSAFDVYNATTPSVSIQDDDTFNGVITSREVNGGIQWSALDTTTNWEVTKSRRVGGADEERTWSFYRHFDFGTTPNNALSSVGTSWGGPRLRSAGPAMWIAEWDEMTDAGGWAQ